MTSLKKYPLHRVWLLAFAVIVVVLCVNGALAYKTLGDLARHQQSVAKTLGTINTVTETYAALLNAEAGQRGYLLTGETKYLDPFRSGIQRMNHHLEELAQVTLPSPEQRALVERLRAAAHEKVEELETVASQLQRNDMMPMPMGLLSSQGKPKMDTVRELVGQLKEKQYANLAEREKDARKSQRDALAILITATVVSLLLVMLIYLVVKMSYNTREKLTSDLQKANEELEQKVRERTATLSHYANELGRSNRELQDFAFVASHDLQEPLRKIRAFGNRLQQKYVSTLDEQGGDYINRMQAAAERMSRLINDLLAFSRVATKGRPFEKTPLNDVVKDVLDDLEVAIEEAQAEIVVDDLPAIDADPTQMRQLFQNLLGNAIKFRAEGVAPHITVKNHIHSQTQVGDATVNDVCEITVTDNGIGFDQQFMERIFTPFQRLHGRDRYAGTGIGLAVCRRIVERHQGSITAQSKRDEGSQFVLKLPLKQNLQTLQEMQDNDAQQSQEY